MIDIKLLRENPQLFIDGARDKNIAVEIDELLDLDEQRRGLQRQKENHRAQQNKLSKKIGPQIGTLKSKLKDAADNEKQEIESQLAELEATPLTLKAEIQKLDDSISKIEPRWNELLLQVPQPPDEDVPRGKHKHLRSWIDNWTADGYIVGR